MNSLLIIMLGLTVSFAMGCAQGNCRSQGHAPASAPETPAAKLTSTAERMKVYKYDGSLQCGMGKAISSEEMAKDLKGIQIYSTMSKADGLMHIAQCGTPSGRANVFEIEKKDFAQAQKAGFKEWLWE